MPMIIKTTKSLCPVCGKVLPADIIEEDGAIWIVRNCPEHGTQKYLYWSDAEMFKQFEEFEGIGGGVENPQRFADESECPYACGLCNNHKSSTLLGNIDLTNRCNLDCEFCFANARACGYIYEPSFEEIIDMLKMLRNERPVPCPAIQFSGGEPTLRDDLVEIVQAAHDLEFSQIQLATNGIKLAASKDLVCGLRDAGLSTVYLHFDGTTKETNRLINISKRVVANCREFGVGIMLVPTIINGVNDHDVGNIIKYAADNVDTIRGVNFQPVAFTGAMSADQIAQKRVTIPDLLQRIEEQTDGILKKKYFYPVPCVLPLTHLAEAYTGEPQVAFTVHQHCGAATYGFVTEKGMKPINELVDVDAFFAAVDEMSERLSKGGTINKYKTLIEGVRDINRSVKNKNELNTSLWKILKDTLIKQDFESLAEFHWNALFVGTMHFMDNFNYDVQRVQRCCIHYATPDGRIIPFCTYNSGPVFREQVWKKYSKPMDHQEEIANLD